MGGHLDVGQLAKLDLTNQPSKTIGAILFSALVLNGRNRNLGRVTRNWRFAGKTFGLGNSQIFQTVSGNLLFDPILYSIKIKKEQTFRS